MPDVTPNADGTIDLLLASGSVRLPEPTASQYARIWDLIDEADSQLPEIGSIDATDATAAQLDERRAQLRARRRAQYSEKSPHALAIIEIIYLLTDRRLTFDELHRSAMRPTTCAALLTAWEIPLDGPADEAPTPVPLVVPSDPASSAVEPSSPTTTDDSSPSPPTSSTD